MGRWESFGIYSLNPLKAPNITFSKLKRGPAPLIGGGE